MNIERIFVTIPVSQPLKSGLQVAWSPKSPNIVVTADTSQVVMSPCNVKVLLVKSGPMAPSHQNVTAVLRVASPKIVWETQAVARRIVLTRKLRRFWMGLRIVVFAFCFGKERSSGDTSQNRNAVREQAAVETRWHGVKVCQTSLHGIEHI